MQQEGTLLGSAGSAVISYPRGPEESATVALVACHPQVGGVALTLGKPVA